MMFKPMSIDERSNKLVSQYGYKAALYFAEDERDSIDTDEHTYKKEYWESVVAKIKSSPFKRNYERSWLKRIRKKRNERNQIVL